MKALLLAAALFAVAAPAAATVNLVTNGNFSAGNAGFTSDYNFKAAPDGNALSEARYTIDTNAINTHFAWASFGDKTGDAAGLYFIANGAGFDSIAWQQTITVNPGSRYNFAAFAANLCCNANQAPPNFSMLDFQVDTGGGFTSVGTFTLSGVGTWLGNTGQFTAGPGTSVLARIVNTNTLAGGNDFALDDISVANVPEPATWSLMVIGFGMVGAGMRRRSGAVAA